MKETDLTGCDFTGAVFDKVDFNDAHFERTILEKADMRAAFNYTIDPEMNSLRKAKFSLVGVTRLLSKYDIEIE